MAEAVDVYTSTDRALLQIDRIEAFLRASYWAPARPRDVIEKSVEASLCLGVYRLADGLQVGFARVVTDCATFGWVCDVFVDETVRGQGLGKLMMETLLGLPELAGVRLLLATADAHGLYRQFGFETVPWQDRLMLRE